MKGNIKDRFLFVLLVLVLYRFGTYIPIPGIDMGLLTTFENSNRDGFLGMFNMFTGGALGRMSIFSLNIIPYITASIMMQISTVIFPSLSSLQKEGKQGKRKISQYTRYLSIILALLQGYTLALGMEKMEINRTFLVMHPGFQFRIIAALNILAGTMFIVWLSDQITAKGIGNGSSIIIFTGIVSGLPSAFGTIFSMGSSGTLSTSFILFIVIVCFSMIYAIVFFEKAQRRIQVIYHNRQIGRKMYSGDTTYLPLKLNTAGVLGPIFANSLLLFPSTIINFLSSGTLSDFQRKILTYFAHGHIVYIVTYVGLIAFFSFFYVSIVFNVDDTTENLKKSGAIVVGKRPGKQTADYINDVLMKITTVGAFYISVICVIPELLISRYALPFYIGGTSFLIIVNVVMDLFQQLQTYFFSSQYSNLMKNHGSIFGIKR